MKTPSEFPIQFPSHPVLAEQAERLGCPKSIPLSVVGHCGMRAIANHGVGVVALAERGGLDPKNLAALIENRTLKVASGYSLDYAIRVINAAVIGHSKRNRI